MSEIYDKLIDAMISALWWIICLAIFTFAVVIILNALSSNSNRLAPPTTKDNEINNKQAKDNSTLSGTYDEYLVNTGKNYSDILFDKGNYGEYLIYECLDHISGYKKFLFNLYIPAGSGHTTEIDVIMLHTSGVYVFESKNYSGWIFGSEKDRFWTQSIYNRRSGEPEKSRFYNPVLQNENHIRHLKNLLNNYSNFPIFSYVVFSERCQLKKVNVDPKSCTVIKSEYLYNDVKLKADFSEKILTDEMLDKLYNILFPYSKVSEQVKEQHIKDVNEYKELYGTAHYTLPNDQTKNNYSERL